MEGSLGSKMRSEWLAAEFAQVDDDGYGIVTEDVAVATICKLCPGIKEAKVNTFLHFMMQVWAGRVRVNWKRHKHFLKWCESISLNSTEIFRTLKHIHLLFVYNLND